MISIKITIALLSGLISLITPNIFIFENVTLPVRGLSLCVQGIRFEGSSMPCSSFYSSRTTVSSGISSWFESISSVSSISISGYYSSYFYLSSSYFFILALSSITSISKFHAQHCSIPQIIRVNIPPSMQTLLNPSGKANTTVPTDTLSILQIVDNYEAYFLSPRFLFFMNVLYWSTMLLGSFGSSYLIYIKIIIHSIYSSSIHHDLWLLVWSTKS